MSDRMTTTEAQAMIEEMLAFERGEVVTEEKGYDIEQKPGKDYWYVKRGGKKLGAISKGKNEKFDADTDTEGGGEYKAGFDTIAAAAEWLVSKDKTAKTESELTEDPVQGAFDHEVKPWLRRELEKLLGQLDKKMQGIMRGQFPEKRMEYGITRYAPLSVGPKDFLKSLRTPYLYWRNEVKATMEAEEPDDEELAEASMFTGYKGPAAHKKTLAALDKKIAVIDKLEDQNMRTQSIIQFVKLFAPGEKKIVEAAKGLEAIHLWMGGLPPGANEIRAAMWRAAAKAASKNMDFHYYNVLKDRLHLPV